MKGSKKESTIWQTQGTRKEVLSLHVRTEVKPTLREDCVDKVFQLPFCHFNLTLLVERPDGGHLTLRDELEKSKWSKKGAKCDVDWNFTKCGTTKKSGLVKKKTKRVVGVCVLNPGPHICEDPDR